MEWFRRVEISACKSGGLEIGKAAHVKIVEFMVVITPDRVVQIVSVADDSKSFVGVIPMEAV